MLKLLRMCIRRHGFVSTNEGDANGNHAESISLKKVSSPTYLEYLREMLSVRNGV